MDQQLTMNKKVKREVFKTGRWSNDQESLFEEGLNFFGKDWRKIQHYVKTRSLLQVRSHAQKYFLMAQKVQTINNKSKTRPENILKSSNAEILKQNQEQNKDYFQKIKVQLQNTSNSKTINQGLTPDCYDYQNTNYQKVVSQEKNQFTNSVIGWTNYISSNTSQSITIQPDNALNTLNNFFLPIISYYNCPYQKIQMLSPWGIISVFNWNK